MKALVALAAITISQAALACPNILGTWKSSKELSMEYNEKFANLEPKQKELLNQILGYMKVTYTRKNITEQGQPTIKVKINGKESDFSFVDLSYTYKLLSCSKSVVNIKFGHPYAGVTKQKINFVDENTYWVSPEVLPATREYFIRVLE